MCPGLQKAARNVRPRLVWRLNKVYRLEDAHQIHTRPSGLHILQQSGEHARCRTKRFRSNLHPGEESGAPIRHREQPIKTEDAIQNDAGCAKDQSDSGGMPSLEGCRIICFCCSPRTRLLVTVWFAKKGGWRIAYWREFWPMVTDCRLIVLTICK